MHTHQPGHYGSPLVRPSSVETKDRLNRIGEYDSRQSSHQGPKVSMILSIDRPG